MVMKANPIRVVEANLSEHVRQENASYREIIRKRMEAEMPSPKIEFRRVERDSPSNKRLRAEGATRGITYDFEVIVDGEKRGELCKNVVGRGYYLADLNYQLVGRSYAESCDQADFDDYVRARLAILPTVEKAFWNAMRDGEDVVFGHMEEQARAEAQLFGRHGWRLLQALRRLHDASTLVAETSQTWERMRALAALEVAEREAGEAIDEAEEGLAAQQRNRDDLRRLLGQ